PAFVDAVQNAGQLRRVRAALQQAFKSAAEFARRDFPRIGRADGGQVRGVDEATLEERNVIVELQSINVEGAFRRPDPAQRGRREQSLIGEVVDSQDRGNF